MFQFRRFPTYAYLIQRRLTEYCSAGFPHSEICGSKLMCSSPQLIAACHVLLRLLMPRHSPCALSSLTYRRFHSDLSENSWFSLRIMQAYKDRNCMSPCILSDAVPQSICFVMCLHKTPLCCLTCFCHIVQFSRCRVPAPLEARSKHSSSLKCFDPVSTLVEISGFEPLTSCLQGRRSPS